MVYVVTSDEAMTGTLAVFGGCSCAPESTLDTSVLAAYDRWSGFVVVDAMIDERFDDKVLVSLMEAAERDETACLDHVQLPRNHPSRAIDAFRVLRALTDRDSGAPGAAATTSLPEAPGANANSTIASRGYATQRFPSRQPACWDALRRHRTTSISSARSLIAATATFDR